MKNRDYDSRLQRFAKAMRGDATDAERQLWQIVRGGRIEGFHFRRQHPSGGYILDFYCDDLRLAIEADGGQHYMPEGKLHDLVRDAALTDTGIMVLRFNDHDILKHSDGVAETIYAKCVERATELGRPLRGARPRARAKATPSLTLPQGGGDKSSDHAEAGEKRGAGAATISLSSPLAEVATSSSSPLGDVAPSSSSQMPQVAISPTSPLADVAVSSSSQMARVAISPTSPLAAVTVSSSSPLGEAGRGLAPQTNAGTKGIYE